ncbi:hypothetical protein, partial [Salinispira pacifica]
MRNPSIPEARHRRRTVSCSAGALNALCCLVCALLALSCSAFTKVEEITSPDLRPPQLVSVR